MIFMWLTHNSLNEITLFAFVLVSGIIVDDAIVITENIYRRLQEGLALHQAVVEGAAEVAVPVIAATTTTIAAFLPMLMMTGSTGEFFAQVPIAVSLALTASLFECLIFLPPHYLDWPGAARAERRARADLAAERELWLMRRLKAWTLALLGWSCACVSPASSWSPCSSSRPWPCSGCRSAAGCRSSASSSSPTST
jgi:HAE1 family hydrophobic/amphiphilic exporter-1